MNQNHSVKKRVKRIEIKDYPFSLNFYINFPREEIELEEFGELAYKRLRLLQVIDEAQIQSKLSLDNKKLNDAIRRYLPLNINGDGSNKSLKELYVQRREDYISHFILRLAYCQLKEKREWLIRQESNLFELRWEKLIDERKEFVESLNLKMETVNEKEKNDLKEDLMYSLYRKYLNKEGIENCEKHFKNEVFYKIPFYLVDDLVSNRAVFVKKGIAYIPSFLQISIILNKFKEHLSKSLNELNEKFSKMGIKEDERLTEILNALEEQRIDDTYTPTNGDVKHQDIPALARYFPLCMMNIQKHLEIDGHLRHGGRMQYGLFLKGIGLPIQEALIFWKKSFTRIAADKFDKSYAYNIRHNYGLEGKRTKYNPYSCIRIIMGDPPSTGDHHGCPFRHSSPDNLALMLKQSGVKENYIPGICEMAKNRHYQLACSKMLEVVTGISSELSENIIHPNRYFDQCYPNSEYNKNKPKTSTDTQMNDLMDI